MQNAEKFDVEYLSAEEFYRTFKVFKENLNEKGPALLVEAIENHQFQTSSLKVSSLGSFLCAIFNFPLPKYFILTLISVALYWYWLW